MSSNSLPYLLAACVAVVITACGGSRDNSLVSDSLETKTATRLKPIDACAVALAMPVDAGHGEASIVRLQRAVAADESDIRPLTDLGWVFLRLARSSFDPGYYVLTEHTATCIEARGGESMDAVALRGLALHNQHRFIEALDLAQLLIAERGLWLDFGLLGDVATELGDIDAAADAYQRMMDLRPGPQAYGRAANLRWMTGDVDGAIEAMSLAVRSSSPRDPEAEAWLRTRLAGYAFAARDLETAREQLHAVLQQSDDYPAALFLLARLHVAADEWAEATRLLDRAVARGSQLEHLWLLSDVLRARGLHDRADAAAKELLRIGETQDPRTLALYLATSGIDSDRAVSLSKRELAVRRDVHTLDAVAWSLHANQSNEEALPYSKRALSTGFTHARLLLHAGSIARARGDFDAARQHFEGARALKHLLFPSERTLLAHEAAALLLQRSPSTSDSKARQTT